MAATIAHFTSTMLSENSRHTLLKVETVVTRLAAGVILAMVIPILFFFVLDIMTFATTRIMDSYNRWHTGRVTRQELRFTSVSIVQKYLHDLSTLLLESRSWMKRFGIRVEEE